MGGAVTRVKRKFYEHSPAFVVVVVGFYFIYFKFNSFGC